MNKQLLVEETAEIHKDGSITFRYLNSQSGEDSEETLPASFCGLYLAVEDDFERHCMLYELFVDWVGGADGGSADWSEGIEGAYNLALHMSYTDPGRTQSRVMNAQRALKPVPEKIVFSRVSVARSRNREAYYREDSLHGDLVYTIPKSGPLADRINGLDERDRYAVMLSVLDNMSSGAAGDFLYDLDEEI